MPVLQKRKDAGNTGIPSKCSFVAYAASCLESGFISDKLVNSLKSAPKWTGIILPEVKKNAGKNRNTEKEAVG